MIVVIKSQTPAFEIERIIQELHHYPITTEKVLGKLTSCTKNNVFLITQYLA